MTRRRRKAAGPPAVVAPDESPIAWPDHPLATSGGEILAARILPLMGHNSRDFALAAAVCRGWRAACRAAASTLSVYRETALLLPHQPHYVFKWSPHGKFVAATTCRPFRIFIWRASTGALVNEWALVAPATAVPQNILESYCFCSVAFSRDSTRVLTLFRLSDHFAVWSVPDGQLIFVNRGDPFGYCYECADFGVPGSASRGLIGFGSFDDAAVDLWDVSPPPGGGGIQPHLRRRVDLESDEGAYTEYLAYSPDGSKFAASFGSVVFVYDVASLTRLGVYSSPSIWPGSTWAPDGWRVLVSWEQSACVWDFSRPEAPSVVTIDVGPDSCFQCWSPSGASYFVTRQLKRPTRSGPATYVLEERKVAEGSLVRAVSLGPDNDFLRMSPDALALLIDSSGSVPARIVVFE